MRQMKKKAGQEGTMNTPLCMNKSVSKSHYCIAWAYDHVYELVIVWVSYLGIAAIDAVYKS